MELKNILIGTIIVSMIIVGASNYLSGLKESYNQNIDLTAFSGTESKLNDTIELSSTMYTRLSRFSNWSDSPVAFLYASFDLIRAGWDGMQLVFTSITTLTTIAHESFDVLTSSTLGFSMPGWVWGSLLAIIFILMFMLLLEMFMRWKFQT